MESAHYLLKLSNVPSYDTHSGPNMLLVILYVGIFVGIFPSPINRVIYENIFVDLINRLIDYIFN